jgi:hypothetical protein
MSEESECINIVTETVVIPQTRNSVYVEMSVFK